MNIENIYRNQTKEKNSKRLAMSKVSLLLVLSIFGALGCAHGDGETLVLLDNLAIKETHSMFFNSLQGEYQKSSFILPNAGILSDVSSRHCAFIQHTNIKA